MGYLQKIKIAIIDDDEDDFLLIQECIKYTNAKITVDWFNSYEAAFPQIISESYDLYFVDYFLGARTGIELLQMARELKVDRPLVLLTGVGSRDIDILAMQCGATDYLVKSDLTTEKVERCIRYSLQRTIYLEEIKAKEKKYYALFEGSRDAVFIADKNLTINESNFSTKKLLSIQNEDDESINLFDFIDDEIQKEKIKNLICTVGKIDEMEITLRNREKELKNCLLSLHVLENESPVIHGIIHDITKFKNAEQAKVLSEKMQANDRLLRVLAHEIRNPLCNVILSTEMLLQEVKSEDHINLLKMMDRNSHRISDLIAELLGLTHPGELILTTVGLQEILEESLNRADDRIKLQKIKVEKKYPKEPLIFSADKNKLVLAFTNILINAVEAMEPGKGTLSIDAALENNILSLNIKDNGRGIPKEYLSKLFEPLFTLKKKGMGLGLTASYSIIQAHNGKMQVESTLGEGTNFSISFKLDEVLVLENI